MNLLTLILIFCFCFFGKAALSQSLQPLYENNDGGMEDVVDAAAKKIQLLKSADSGRLWITKSFYICKQLFSADAYKLVSVSVTNKKHSPGLFTFHGNISYDFFYRSRIDTPVNQKDLQQHTERVYLNVVYKQKYPMRISLLLRQSNSPFFSNFADLNFQFDRFAFNRNIRQLIFNKVSSGIPKLASLIKLEEEIKNNKEALQKMKDWASDPSTVKKIMAEKEDAYYKKVLEEKNALFTPDSLAASIITEATELKNISNANVQVTEALAKADSTADTTRNRMFSLLKRLRSRHKITTGDKADSLQEKFTKQYEKNKLKIDSLEKKIQLQQQNIDSLKTIVFKNAQKIQQQISKASGEKELKKIAAENGFSLDSISGFDRKLASLRNFSIGRSMVDYTELTAQNITITGLNAEYNPGYYYAFAAGRINYRFRDFFNRDRGNTNSQYLVMGRFGIGNIEKAAIILTVFQGKKSQSGFALSDSVNGQVSLLGYSVEGIWKKNEHTGISVEVAKSTLPNTGMIRGTQQTKALWNFSENSNMGLNIKFQTAVAASGTRASGFFRKTGENFQSFSLFTYNTDQTAWQARIDQELFKKRITVTGILRRNDFTNPFTERTFKTSTVFKSFLVNVRIPKYPTLTAGYYPGTQLYVVNKDVIRENAYYILNGSLFYAYRLKGISMYSTAVYNRYFNQATDSGFVLYKGTNCYLSQTLFFKRLQLQAGYSYNRQPELQYYTLESSIDYTVKAFLKIGAGIKSNTVQNGNVFYGSRIQLSAGLKKLGSLQVQYEKSYLPGLQQSLYPVEMGRVSWYKIF